MLNGVVAQIISEETALLIDHEVKKLVQNAYDTAKEILTTHRVIMDKITQTLLEKETIDHDEIQQVISRHQG